MATNALVKKLATPLTEDLGITDGDEIERLVAVLAKVAKLGEGATDAAPAVIPLLAVLGHSPAAIDALSAMIPEIVARDFVDALRGGSEVIVAALDAVVSKTEDDPALPAFLDVMRDAAVPVLIDLARGPHRAAVLNPLGLLGADDPTALAAIASYIGDKDVAVRIGAARGLAHAGERAVPHLEKLIDKADRNLGGVNQAVVSGLAKIGSKRAHAVLQKLATTRGDIGRFAADMPALVASNRRRAASKTAKTGTAGAAEAKASAEKATRAASRIAVARRAAMKPRPEKSAAKKK